MSPFRSDIWVSAFVRRHNDIGHICVVARRGDPVAGQIFLLVDHLNGTVSLFTPAPAAQRPKMMAPTGSSNAASIMSSRRKPASASRAKRISIPTSGSSSSICAAAISG